MSSGLLPDHIGPLVDRLRAGDHLPIALPDVAAVTEVLMRSLESYFKSIDLTLYKECQELADYIEDARSEISSLSSDGGESVGIPRAGQELDAIVEATESATDTIMQSAEDLMSFDSDDFDEYKDHINTEVMKIFEACSFQDITGQRISKVVKTLNHVEDRVGKLVAILGIATTGSDGLGTILEKSGNDNNENPDAEINEEDLLNGPALEGEGIDQGDVDSLLNDIEFSNPNAEEADEVAAEAPSLEVETELPQEDTGNEEIETADVTEQEEAPTEEVEEIQSAETEAATVNTVSIDEDSNSETESKKSQPAETTQEDIDSLFS